MVDKRRERDGAESGAGARSGLARYLSRPEASFDIREEIETIKQTAAWRETGHNAKELVKYPDLRIALIVLKAWKRIEGHKADARISIQTIHGKIKIHLPDEVVQLGSGRLLTLERGVKHDIEAEEESAFLLTICWPARERQDGGGDVAPTLATSRPNGPNSNRVKAGSWARRRTCSRRSNALSAKGES